MDPLLLAQLGISRETNMKLLHTGRNAKRAKDAGSSRSSMFFVPALGMLVLAK